MPFIAIRILSFVRLAGVHAFVAGRTYSFLTGLHTLFESRNF